MTKEAKKTTDALARGYELLWEGLPEPKKGPKPALTLERIVVTAIEIADAEGIDALSMRHLAQRLGVGTMSLYRYVPSKVELLGLMLDHVIAVPWEEADATADGDDEVAAKEPAEPWRLALESYAWRQRDLYLRHSWYLRVNLSRPMLGPNSVGELEHTLRGIRSVPLSDREKIALVTTIDGFIAGTVQQQVLYEEAARESGISDEEFWGVQEPLLMRAMTSGRFPTLASLADDVFEGTWEEHFSFGLRHLLNGFEVEMDRRRREYPGPA